VLPPLDTPVFVSHTPGDTGSDYQYTLAGLMKAQVECFCLPSSRLN